MININDITAKVSITKDLITDQTFTDLTKKLNTSGVAFDAVEGLGDDSATSSAILINAGGFPDQEILAELNYPSPTTAGSEDIGVLGRVLSFDSPNASYYYACVDGGFAKIRRILNGSFSTLTSSAFALQQGVDVNITFRLVGDLLTADFVADSGPSEVHLSTTNSDLPQRGVMGFRSMSSTLWVKGFTANQL